MGEGPIQPVTIDTILNNKGLNIGDGLNFVSLRVNRPLVEENLNHVAARSLLVDIRTYLMNYIDILRHKRKKPRNT